MKHNYFFDTIKFNHKYPLLASIGKQVVFWIIAFNLLFFIVHHHTISIFSVLGSSFEAKVTPLILFVILMGLFFGVALGLLDYGMKKTYNKNHPLGVSILVGGVLYFILVMGLVYLTRSITQFLSDELFLDQALEGLFSDANWRHFNYILMGYTFFMTLVISFIGQMNQKFGPGYLLPILFGRFRYPREEERIFMFLDLASSTKLAEQLGHIKYSALIQDCFLDINIVVRKHNADIYQYVGDEVVVSWPSEALQNYACTEFFFAVQKRLVRRKLHYTQTYGVLPSFKAGLHMGIVTMVEVGDVKRDIAYHGDTLNVAARLEELCNETQQPILVSAAVKERLKLDQKYTTISIGHRKLSGREVPVEIFGLAPHN